MRRFKLFSSLLLVTSVVSSPVVFADESKPTDVLAAKPQAETSKSANESIAEVESAHLQWISDLAEAQKIARAENKDLLLFFTGSDWCAYCKKLEKAVLNTPEFQEAISSRYVPVILDFPQGTKLPEEITQQNDKLKTAFDVSSFPSVFLAEVSVLPYGKLSGFSGPEPFWKNFKAAARVGENLRTAKNNVEVAAISDPQLMDRVVETVPDSLLAFGWSTQIERLGSSNVAGSAEFKTKWSSKLAEIQATAQDREIMAEAGRKLAEMQKAKAPSQEVLAFLDAGISDAAERPARLYFFRASKSQYLRTIGEYEQSLALIDLLLDMPKLTRRQRSGLEQDRVSTLLSMGKIDEGLQEISKAYEHASFPSDEVRQQNLLMTQAMELHKAGQNTVSIPYWRKLIENPPAESNVLFMARLNADSTFRDLGAEHELRGMNALSMAKNPQFPAGMKLDRACLAAACFRAANRADLAEQALAIIEQETPAAMTELEERAAQNPAIQEKMLEMREEELKAAKGSQTDALQYLAKNTPSFGRANYLLEAALVLRSENKTDEANQLAAKAVELTETLTGHIPDTAAKEHQQNLLKKWSTERS